MTRTCIFLLSACLLLEGCALADDNRCFTTRPSVVRPDPRLALANLNTGAAGRAVADAIFAGDIDAVRRLISADPKLLTTEVSFDKNMQAAPAGQYGDLLSFAVAHCDAAMVVALLELGMPADGVQKGEALTLALLSDTPDIADLLLKAGANPDPQKQGGKNIVHELSAFGAAGGIQTLIRHRLDLNYVDSFGNDHLDSALSMEQYAIAELLVQAGAPLWRINGAGALSAWTLNKPPVLQPGKADMAARQRLIAAAQKRALPWPPPNPEEVRKMVLAKAWPTAEMEKAGMVLSAEAKADIEKRFGENR
jgi:ankyrin repeat protein